ncbi:MAG: hypothetical protein WCK17_09775, partial [Verrucomicrobiota bacterium]
MPAYSSNLRLPVVITVSSSAVHPVSRPCATASTWPRRTATIQHRGGRAGFLRVLGPHQLGFADFKGNRQMLTTGN